MRIYAADRRGRYNIMQPEIAGALRARKLETLHATAPDVIAAGNIGCLYAAGGRWVARRACGGIAGLDGRRREARGVGVRGAGANPALTRLAREEG